MFIVYRLYNILYTIDCIVEGFLRLTTWVTGFNVNTHTQTQCPVSAYVCTTIRDKHVVTGL